MFKIDHTDDGRVPGLEYMPTGTITPKAGMLLKMSGGVLVAAAATERPVYFSMTQRETPCEEGDVIPVIRIAPDMVFETEAPAGFSAVPGTKVRLNSAGTGIVNTAGGAAEVVSSDKETVQVRFVQPDAA